MRIVYVVIISFMLLLAGCLSEYFEAPDPGIAPRPSSLVLALGWDASLSCKIRDIPEISTQTMDSILAIVRHRGGEVGFISIDNHPPKLNRIKLSAEQGDANEIYAARKQNEDRLARSQQPIYQALRARSAPRTRLFDCLETLLFYLKEPHHDQEAQKLLLVVSDFEEDWRAKNKWHPLPLPADVSVITIGAHPDSIAQVLQGKVHVYTTPEGAIEFLKMEDK